MSDLSNFGRKKAPPFGSALRAQHVRITGVKPTGYMFVITDIASRAFGPAPGPAGLEAGDVLYAIPVAQGGWILYDPERTTIT